MQNTSTSQNILLKFGFNTLSKTQTIEALSKWIALPKKQRKQDKWYDLFFTIINLIMPDVQFHQLVIQKDIFKQKLLHITNACKFRCQVLFNGMEIKLNEGFLAIDYTQKLQKVTIQANQIKQITSISSFILIKKGQISCMDKKQKILIYNKDKKQKTIFLTIQLKLLERIKNDLFKQDQLNKNNFFSNYIFGDNTSKFGIFGVKIIEVKQNQCLKQKVNTNLNSIYVIFRGSFVCQVENLNLQENQQKDKVKNQKLLRVKQNNLTSQQLSSSFQNQNYLQKIQLNKGFIIQFSGFQELLEKINRRKQFLFHRCKALVDSLIFQIKVSEFSRILFSQRQWKNNFISFYDKIEKSRKVLFQKTNSCLRRLNEASSKQQMKANLSINRQKSYRGFRSKTTRNSLQDLQNLATIQIYDTMIQNKQKVLSLQKDYKNKQQTKKLSPTNYRFQDNKKIKQNYKRLKIKDFQIQKLAFRNSISSPKTKEGVANIKNMLGQVKGMFQDQIQDVQKMIKQQRKAMLDFQTHKQNKYKRKGIRLKSYSPQTSNLQNRANLVPYKTCSNSRKVSVDNNSIAETLRQMVTDGNSSTFDIFNRTKLSINFNQSPKQVRNFKKKQNQFKESQIQILINGQKKSSKIITTPFNCITNSTTRDVRRNNRRAKTNFKPTIRFDSIKSIDSAKLVDQNKKFSN